MPGIAIHKATMWVQRTRPIAFWFLALLVAASIGVLVLGAKPAHASTFTVNSTGDELAATLPDGNCDVDPRIFVVRCTLREALEEANANNNDATVVDTINFNIPTTNCNANTGVCTISPGSGLPIVTEPVIIDGYTQPGASENTLAVGNNAVLLIRLDGNNAGFGETGLNITANDSVVRGLSVTRFSSSAGLTLSGADNTTIEGNFLGTSPGGTQDLGNGWGLFLQRHFIDSANASSNNTVGGTSPEDRNLISGNSMGVEIQSGGGNKVIGNYIGTTKSGTGNLGNRNSGVLVTFEGANNTIGGNGAARNTIAFNGGDGVQIGVTIFEAGVTGNSILRNSIFSNVGLGIDLGNDGRTANDVGDADTGPNNLQNFPVLTSAETVGATTTIRGRLNSTPLTTFVVRFFSNPSNDNEGKRYLGQTSVDTNASGNTGTFTFVSNQSVGLGQRITATATDPAGNTSEFSAAREVEPGVIG